MKISKLTIEPFDCDTRWGVTFQMEDDNGNSIRNGVWFEKTDIESAILKLEDLARQLKMAQRYLSHINRHKGTASTPAPGPPPSITCKKEFE